MSICSVEGTSPYVVVSLCDSRKVACMAGRQHAQQVGGDSVYISQLPYQTDIIMTSMWRPTKPASPSQHVATVYVH